MSLCDDVCRSTPTTSVRMLKDYGNYLDGVGGQWSRERAFKRGRIYHVCPHVALTLIRVAAAVGEG